MTTLVLTIVCTGLFLTLVVVGIVIFIVMQAGQRDTVSTAREGWIHRRSEKDEHGW